MRKLLIVLFFVPNALLAQSLSISQLWQSLGTQNLRDEVALRQSLARTQLAETRSAWLPVVYADAGMQHNLVIPTTPVPAIAFDPDAAPGEITPLKFATEWSSRAGAHLEWTVFDPSRRSDIAIRTLEVQKSELEADELLHQWRVDAVLAYTAVVLATQQNEQTRQDSIHYAQVLHSISARVDAGRAHRSEYLEARQEMERIHIRRLEAWNVLKDASMRLLTEVPDLEIAQLTSSLEEIVDFVAAYTDPTYREDLLQTEVQIAKENLVLQQAARWPTLSFQTYYGGQYFDNSLRLADWDRWYGNSYASLSLRIPLSEYIWSRNPVRSSRLQADLKVVELKNQQEQDELERAQRRLNQSTFSEKVASLREIVRLAQENAELQLEAYQAGRVLLSVYHQALLNQAQALQELWQTQYDWVQAILNP